jgi:hypothetical protein
MIIGPIVFVRFLILCFYMNYYDYIILYRKYTYLKSLKKS